MTDAVCALTVLYAISMVMVLIGLNQLKTWVRCRELQANLRLLDELNANPETHSRADCARHARGERA